ncbi:CYTH domain-containing protein [Rubrivirga sp. IMCC43871]|uniref:CYTH domain-containing protein n=1 Tax=Rubrivirga sp. IMCC43871 TaxID=3391575 RepID=UPI0039900E5B
MPSTTFVARRPGPFSALVQAPELGGLRLDPHPPVRVLDRYFDTEDGELLRRGVALRVREQGGGATVSLRRFEPEAGPVCADLDLVTIPGDGVLALPPSALSDALAMLTGGDAVHPLLSIRLYRTPRLVLRDGHPAAVISFDVVVYEVPGARVVSNEVEVEPVPGGSVDGLAEAFLEAGLERVDQSRLERAVRRFPRTLDEPALLLPDEVEALDVAAAGDDDRALRARIVQLDGRGFRADTIAAQTGVSMGHVRAVREGFRSLRLGVLDPSPVAPAPDPGSSGDGRPGADEAADMAELLDLFSNHTPPVTPLFAGGDLDGPEPNASPRPAPVPASLSPSAPAQPTPAPPVAAGPLPAAPSPVPTPTPGPVLAPAAPATVSHPRPEAAAPPLAVEHTRPSTPLDPYPVVLGPVPIVAREPQGDGHRPRAAPSTGDEPRFPAFVGDMPVLRAAESLVSYHVARFDARAARFALTRAPSDARRLLVAAHGLRLAVETFDRVLPDAAARRVVAALRPLATRLSDALDAARAAAATGRADLARLAADRVGQAADHLGAGPQVWGDRARRLASRLDAAAEAGLRSDDVALADDYVGPPGDAPTPTRLRHVLGSAVWSRFEAVCAFEDDLGTPTPELAAHLAVALSGLHAVVELAGDPAEVLPALASAERAVVEARGRHLAASLSGSASGLSLTALPQIWRDVTEAGFRRRLASVVASV